MDLSSHLTPDVLEVVREVAMQEDSFLLRAQQVDLERLADERTPLITSSAPFLSKVERLVRDREAAQRFRCRRSQ